MMQALSDAALPLDARVRAADAALAYANARAAWHAAQDLPAAMAHSAQAAMSDALDALDAALRALVQGA